MKRFTQVSVLLLLSAVAAHAQAVRMTPDSTNAAVPYNALQYQRDVNTEVKALWKRTPEKLGNVSGTNTITATASGSDVGMLTAYGSLFILRPVNTNDGPVTLNVDSVGSKDILDIDGNALDAGELVAGRDHLIYYDGTAFRLLANGSAPPPTIAQPGPVKIDQVVVTSPTSAIVFATGLNTTYDHYTIKIAKLKSANDDVRVQLQVGTGAGPIFQTSNYNWSALGHANGSAVNAGGGSQTSIGLSNQGGGTDGLGNAAGEDFDCDINFTKPTATDFQLFRFQCAFRRANGDHVVSWNGAGYHTTAEAITAVRINLSSGNITEAVATLYGWPK